MKMYNAPTINTVELDFVDVIATSGEIDTTSYNFKATAADDTKITYTNKGQAWQDSWN